MTDEVPDDDAGSEASGAHDEASGLGLDEAYAVETPDDNRRLYAAWAPTYDTGFLIESGYVYDAAVARLFVATGGRGPVLDVGCGTGAVGIRLAERGVGPIDGLDISPEMLDVAATKAVHGRAVYRSLLVGDLTAGVEVADNSYAGVVSAGTFTHGHLGPDSLDEVVRLGTPGCRFAIGINAEHHDSLGFGAHIARLVERGAITDVDRHDVAIYENNTTDHGADRALVVIFTKT